MDTKLKRFIRISGEYGVSAAWAEKAAKLQPELLNLTASEIEDCFSDEEPREDHEPMDDFLG